MKNQLLTLGLSALVFLNHASGKTTLPANAPKGFKEQKTSDLCFTENKGQVSDQNYKPRPDVLFGGSVNGMAFHLRNNGISYQLNRTDSWKEVEDPKTKEKRKVVDQSTIYRLDINWLNSNTNFKIETDNALAGCNNYYLEVCPNGVNNVKSYEGVWYNNIYNNINLHYYQKNNTLKYDYIVAPGADYKQIQLQIKGASNITLQKDGSLLLKTPLGNINEGAPLVYQNGRQLIAKWIIKQSEQGQVLSFDIKNYNPTQELIIDPAVRLWGTYYGGVVDESGYACATDAADNVYLAGYTASNTGTIIATTGSHQTTLGGNYDAFLVKFNSSGVRQWGTYYGGPGDDRGYACAIDAAGNVYLAGWASLSTGTVIATAGSHQITYGGGIFDAFLVKFNSSGVRQWGTYYGGTGDDEGWACTTDATGNVYLAGHTDSNTGTIIATAGSHQSTYGAGGYDAFLVKFNSSGVRQWGTYYGGTSSDRGYGCTTDAGGNVYLTGQTASNTGTVIATAGSHQSTFGGSYDAFLVKFNSSGVRQWGTYYGGALSDDGAACATDAGGNVYLAGVTDSGTGTVIATTGSHQTIYGGNWDAFLVKFNSSGVRQWGTYYGGAGATDYGSSCATDAGGNVYLAGQTPSSTGTIIATAGSHQSTFGGATYDAFLVKFNSNGVRQWGTYYGGTGNESGRTCATDVGGNVYLAGNTSLNTGTAIATAASHQSAYGGGSYDAFLVKFTTPPGEALNFDGTDDYVNIGTSLLPSFNGANKITLEAWVNPSTTAGLGAIVGNYSTPGPSMQFLLRRDGSNFNFFINNGTFNSVLSAATVSLNTWTHLAGTWDGATMRLYVNGVLSGSATVGGAMITYTNPIWIGGEVAGGGEYFNGSIDEVRIWNRALCVTEIQNNMNAQIPTNANGLLVNYHFNQGIAADPNPTVTTLVDASFTALTGTLVNIALTGTISNWIAPGGVSSSSSVTPYVPFAISVNSGSICSGNSFTMMPSGASTYTFQGGNPIVSPGTSNNYTVVGTNSLACISNAVTSSVTVYATPTISVNNGSICIGNSFTIVPSGANTYTIQGGSSVVSPTTATSYTVVGTSTAGCVSASSATANITINGLPTITINSGSICSGNSFTIIPSGANTYTIQGGSSVVSPTVNATYTVAGTSTAGCVSASSATSNITVNGLPTIGASTTNTLICAGETATLTASGASTYTFNPGGAGNNIAVSPTVTATYTITGTDANGCTNSTAFTQSVSACTGVQQLANLNFEINIYPNPTSGEIFIKGFTDAKSVHIYNPLGQEVASTSFTFEGGIGMKLEQASGIYFIRIGTLTKKIIKE